MSTKKVQVDVRDLITGELEREERNLAWLAKKTKLSYGHLYFVLVRKERDLTEDNRTAINKILNTNF